MGQTRYFSLAFFDFGDRLDSAINIQKEIDRFVVIDKQLYGLYRVFGNGVINGWTVRDAGYQEGNGITVSVDEGVGIIDYKAAETFLPGYLYGLPPNSIVDIYATIMGSTSQDRVVNFVYSSIELVGTEYIRLARISTGSDSVIYIDNNTRDLIGFEQVIEDAINEHKHRGTPSKIDLSEETKNQLPGARISDIDAAKVTSGKFNIDRIPILDHNQLDNRGLLTHAALDSFVKTMSQNNKELLGEISSVNLLKSILFLKYKYADVDEHFINELALIPGISPNSFIDFTASTAVIDLDSQCISGKPAKSGIFTSVYWNNSYSFNAAIVKNNVIIKDDEVTLDRSSQIIDSIADFSDRIIGFIPETLIIDNNTQAAVAVEDGNLIGRMGGGVDVNYFYRRNFGVGNHKNWDGTYDELVIKVKTNEQIHSPLYMYVVNGGNINSSGDYGSIETGDIDGIKKPSSSWVLLDEDEYMSSFEEKVFNISNLELNDVSQITIYTADDFTFDIDDLYVRRTNMVSESGTIRFRYTTEANVIFHSVFYNAISPQDTSISIRMKTAASQDLLSRSAYSLPLDSGDVVAMSGTAAEIEVTMTSNDNRTLSPVLSSLELRILVDADFTGFVIDTESEWLRGTLDNASTNDSEIIGKSYITISEPINVGGRYFAKNSSISEINNSNIGVYGFSGSSMPISPAQARSWSSSSGRGFSTVSSVIRRFNNNFIIADLGNNRVLEVDNNGNLVRGFGSTYSKDSNFYPLTASYSHTSKILSIVFTKSAVVQDITKIAFYLGSSKIALTSDDVILNNNKANNKVLEILLDDDTAIRLLGATADNLSVNFYAGAFTETIVTHSGMSSQGNSIFSPLKGLICFVGEFIYMDNIKHPVFVSELENGNWIVANSSIFYEEIDNNKEEYSVVPDIFEFDPEDVTDVDNKLLSSDIKFSDYTLGSIYEYESNKFVIAGISESTENIPGITGDELLEKSGGAESASDNLLFRAAALDDLKNYRGYICIFDKINNKKQIFYICPDGLYPSDVSICSNGDLLISESSFGDASGRLIRLDAYGNMTWNYGSGTFNIINDAKVLSNDKIVVSV